MTVIGVQKIVFILALLVGCALTGCVSTQTSNKPKNVFSFPRVTQEKETEKAAPSSMQEVLRQERIPFHP